ncbi:MAG: phosphonopyruvate decarboxylase [Rhodospirillaceae bacterium]|jgi:sulfopyruvate decarboxylase alpha subunit|nr:phosphonopyruvate decarboxylase [Rhodospirillaceae bacterium]MBT4488580.1 phosphonopyruvate decarboxylase [Rhodospirillaceae bacterium]MBT5193839.1 phosphonopyruvate decarboxylase [Rhodospirillaceae bacterium]MBT5896515.1 phosphonopyruvate decarboxylase [Rhodospirillaceae bacterium]MBT6429991.1 phosphonopyruvate decarboxylase [Rhodospirillaceae bacterium]
MQANQGGVDPVDWTGAIYSTLQDWQVAQVAYVPDAGHSELIIRCDRDENMRLVPLTTEEEGIALLAGAWLGGQRGVLLMQSSGVGNCINMLSLARVCRFPLLTLVTMRGQWGEFNPWQVPMGQLTPKVLADADSLVFSVDDPAAMGQTVAGAARMAFEGPAQAAVLIGQAVIGAKSFGR